MVGGISWESLGKTPWGVTATQAPSSKTYVSLLHEYKSPGARNLISAWPNSGHWRQPAPAPFNSKTYEKNTKWALSKGEYTSCWLFKRKNKRTFCKHLRPPPSRRWPPMGFYLGILMKSPPPWGGTQVDDFTKGFSKGQITKNNWRRNGGVRGTQTPLLFFCFVEQTQMLVKLLSFWNKKQVCLTLLMRWTCLQFEYVESVDLFDLFYKSFQTI